MTSSPTGAQFLRKAKFLVLLLSVVVSLSSAQSGVSPQSDRVVGEGRARGSFRKICNNPEMRIEGIPFATTDWSSVPETEHPGETGVAYWRTKERGNVRVRMVLYSAGYRADHWCSRGHILLVLDGELTTELQDGSVHVLSAGMTYEVASNVAPHRSSTEAGATLFIVD